jgi:CRISPR/Cas system Type II protein with McrA/HNH and RuvC-like nuclease domain
MGYRNRKEIEIEELNEELNFDVDHPRPYGFGEYDEIEEVKASYSRTSRHVLAPGGTRIMAGFLE